MIVPPPGSSSALLTKRQRQRARAAINRSVRAENASNGTSHHLLPGLLPPPPPPTALTEPLPELPPPTEPLHTQFTVQWEVNRDSSPPCVGRIGPTPPTANVLSADPIADPTTSADPRRRAPPA